MYGSLHHASATTLVTQSLLVVLEDTKIWLCYLLYSLVAWLQNTDYTQFKLVMQSILMGHQGDVHPLKRSVKAHLLNNVLGKLNAMLSIL